MNSQSKKMELLGRAPIPKALLAMGIPTMIGMLVNAFYNLVDAYFVGGLGESQMGAISVVYTVSGNGGFINRFNCSFYHIPCLYISQNLTSVSLLLYRYRLF